MVPGLGVADPWGLGRQVGYLKNYRVNSLETGTPSLMLWGPSYSFDSSRACQVLMASLQQEKGASEVSAAGDADPVAQFGDCGPHRLLQVANGSDGGGQRGPAHRRSNQVPDTVLMEA